MLKQFAMALCTASILAGCGGASDSRLNPLNWFGRSETVEIASQGTTTPRANLIAQVVTLRAESVPGGAILQATGVAPRQGFYGGELVPLAGEVPQKGVLAYEFRISNPLGDTLVGPAHSREVLVGRFVSEQTLQGVRQIRVNGATNGLVVRR